MLSYISATLVDRGSGSIVFFGDPSSGGKLVSHENLKVALSAIRGEPCECIVPSRRKDAVMATDEYALSRGYIESTRLGYQHYLWKETLGYLLHPSIALNGPHLRVADIGTHNGIWLLDLIKDAHPSTLLDGFDISASGFPHQTWLPSNISFSILDSLKEPPEELWGKYDIVHLRLFLIVVNDNDPTPLLRHCMKLLKPGGLLQWEEYDPSDQRIIAVNPTVPTKSLQVLLDYKDAQKQFGWVKDLPRTLVDSNFEDVEVSRLHEHRWHTRTWMEMELVLADELAGKLLGMEGPSGSGEELKQLAKDVYSEVQQGASIERTLQVVTAKKPAK